MDGNVNEADVVLNRLNVALARSQRIINSWLPQKSPEEEQKSIRAQDDDEDFKPMAEDGGIGSNVAYDDDTSPARALQRKKLASNDKLLEQLLGKKVAQAHKKSQETRKSMSAAKHAAPKPLASRPKPSQEVQSEDEEEGGRSAAFKSRKSSKRRQHPVEEPMPTGVENDATTEEDTGLRGVSESANDDERAGDVSLETDEKPAKRQGNTYLDELLAQKAKKRKKKKARLRAES